MAFPLNSLPLAHKISLYCALSSALPVLLIGWLCKLSLPWLISSAVGSAILAILLIRQLSCNLVKGMQSLETGLLNFKDGELSSLLAYNQRDELGQLCQLYNQTAKQLRQEKQWVYQRELMLDKVLQSSPQALLLINDNDTVVFSNLSSRALFNCANALEGMKLTELLKLAPKQLATALAQGFDGLFSIEKDAQEAQTWHLATGEFLLNNQRHHLYIFKQLTRELSRQEVAVWKKVIRIISHELNNSLGPMSSMLHSAQLLANKVDEPRLSRVFATIDERIAHLTAFVQGYGKFAKLPQPQRSPIEWPTLLTSLQTQWQFHYQVTPSQYTTHADQTQVEQLLINLLKNAHESGADPQHINVNISHDQHATLIAVSDNGKGMSEQVMANALIPFYSTKTSGSGLGLALCREIAEAHRGHISLHNHKQGGLSVHVVLPHQSKTQKQ